MPQMGLKLPPDTLLTPSLTLRIQGSSHRAIENKGFFLIGHQKGSLACFATRNRSGGCHQASNGLKTSSRHPPDTLPNIEDPGIEPLRHRKQRFFLNRAPEGLVRGFRHPKSFWWLPPGPKWAHRTLSILSTLASNGLDRATAPSKTNVFS